MNLESAQTSPTWVKNGWKTKHVVTSMLKVSIFHWALEIIIIIMIIITISIDFYTMKTNYSRTDVVVCRKKKH